MRFIIEVKLCDVKDPLIWRKLAVPAKLAFHELHLMIQAAMGWRNSHLYSFKESSQSRYFHIVSPFAEEQGIDAARAQAHDILLDYLNQFVMEGEYRDKMLYLYDYGDSWLHEIDVVGFDRSNKSAVELLDGTGACPPEDCGGISGFTDIKVSLSTGEPSEIHGNSWVPWLEGCGYRKYDPEVFSLVKGKREVKKWGEFLRMEREG